MTDVSGLRVRQLFDKPEELQGRLEREVKSDVDPDAKRAAMVWRFVGDTVNDRVMKVLDFDVLELLAQAWSKVKELRKYADTEAFPSGMKVHLGRHDTPPVRVHPLLMFVTAGQPLAKLQLTLEIIAQFDSVALHVKDGHIVAIGAGQGRVKAKLKYKTVTLCDMVDSQPVEAKAYTLRNPVRIPPLRPG